MYILLLYLQTDFNVGLSEITNPIPETFINAQMAVFESSSRIFNDKNEQFILFKLLDFSQYPILLQYLPNFILLGPLSTGTVQQHVLYFHYRKCNLSILLCMVTPKKFPSLNFGAYLFKPQLSLLLLSNIIFSLVQTFRSKCQINYPNPRDGKMVLVHFPQRKI